MTKKAVVLLSGGIDSTTALAIARSEGYECYTMSFEYGQRQDFEVYLAEALSREAGAKKHMLIRLELHKITQGSALTGDVEVPKDRTPSEMGEGIPITYVPARNTIFLSYALGWAETLGADDIFIGVNGMGSHASYPDCMPGFVRAYEDLMNVATGANAGHRPLMRLHAPLMHDTKADIIAKGLKMGLNYMRTMSCYSPVRTNLACGRCDACTTRLQAFKANNMEDPAVYAFRS